MTRLIKQLICLGIYLVLAGLIIWPVYRFFVPAPTCADGVQNGDEEGVDCGAVACGVLCPPPVIELDIKPTQIIGNADGSWDLLLRLDNPNNAYGATEVPIMVTVSDASGTTLAVRRDTTYVNPSQPRYLFWTLGKLTAPPATAEVTLEGERIRWALLPVESAGSVQFGIRNDTLQRADASVRYTASVANRSRFSFDTVDISVLLHDVSGAVVGAGSTVVRTLTAGEERGFVIDWPFPVPDADRAEVIVGTNLFSTDNFLREYGSEENVEGL